MKEKLQNQRVDYQKGALSIDQVNKDPLQQFQDWYEQFELSKPKDPNAFVLATAGNDGIPHARVLLLKGVDQGGFEFYTNYESAKGQELAENPQASMCFFWSEQERQVRVEGKVVKLRPEESTAYFHSRPHGSQVGAWVSPQSKEIADRKVLEDRAQHYADKYAEEVPRPPHWGGYRLMPNRIEFWQGRSSRLHDRILYTLQADGSWQLSRLAP
jgi:pyridoxamine 5'-phosphate oxidase